MKNGTSGSNQEAYSLSMFHQLHCLAHMKLGLDGLLYALEQDEPVGESQMAALRTTHHIDHCFDYIRQVCQDTIVRGIKGGLGKVIV